jgi:alkaline phosphatase D
VQGRDTRATNPSRTLLTLYDYRTRIAQYRTDTDLQLSHQKFAWIATWDDHEVANNGYRDGFSAMNNTEDSFLRSGGVSVDQRKMNAVRAYFEWMPIRQVNMDDNLRIWRNFQMGTLLDLTMLDTRNYDRSITDLSKSSTRQYLKYKTLTPSRLQHRLHIRDPRRRWAIAHGLSARELVL